MTSYSLIFWTTLAANVGITYRSLSNSSPSSSATDTNSDEADDMKNAVVHKSLLVRYLSVYLLAALSDWLQGPYVYALYNAYGYEQKAIAVLFVAGFGSSMIFGSFVGGMADSGGRRKFVIIFALTYIASCITKHFKSFSFLLLGRFLGGVSTSLLFSVFDSWLIKAHAMKGLEGSFLSKSFAAASYGNYVVAILAGLVANHAAGMNDMVEFGSGETVKESPSGLIYYGGYINPFDMALVALILCGSLATALWDENYGEQSPSSESGSLNALRNAAYTVVQNEEVLLCGIISSLFEGSMYVFVFMWTPALTALTPEGDPGLPFGLIFATFMVCCMAGSSTFTLLLGKKDMKVESLAVYVLGLASFALFNVAISGSDLIAFLSMLLFELTVGLYFPSMGTMKSQIVPESQRSAIYNIFRIPLNFIVLTSLLTNLSYRQSFFACGCMLLAASLMQMKLKAKRLNGERSGENPEYDQLAPIEEKGTV
mmetsp:Transcript_20231/g.30152  ORF Transcript_20231/g.30152 Transcript_20231/m.30152 type:complete len:484 (+) Transcript_20231:97-1548(+)